MSHNRDMDDTWDLVRSIRETLRDFRDRAEKQNSTLKAYDANGFIHPMPVDDDQPTTLPADSEQDHAGMNDALTGPFSLGDARQQDC